MMTILYLVLLTGLKEETSTLTGSSAVVSHEKDSNIRFVVVMSLMHVSLSAEQRTSIEHYNDW